MSQVTKVDPVVSNGKWALAEKGIIQWKNGGDMNESREKLRRYERINRTMEEV
jgi:hypothetical protein